MAQIETRKIGSHVKDKVSRPSVNDTSGAPALEFTIGTSSLGLVLVARNSRGLCAVLFGDDARALQKDLTDRFPDGLFRQGGQALDDLATDVIALVDSPDHRIDIPLDPAGTPFQRLVWEAMREIPVGGCASYTEIARRIGRPRSVRAVAQACGANPLAVLIPCHRVVRSDGGLSGYRWGVERKRRLLEMEAGFGEPLLSDEGTYTIRSPVD